MAYCRIPAPSLTLCPLPEVPTAYPPSPPEHPLLLPSLLDLCVDQAWLAQESCSMPFEGWMHLRKLLHPHAPAQDVYARLQ